MNLCQPRPALTSVRVRNKMSPLHFRILVRPPGRGPSSAPVSHSHYLKNKSCICASRVVSWCVLHSRIHIEFAGNGLLFSCLQTLCTPTLDLVLLSSIDAKKMCSYFIFLLYSATVFHTILQLSTLILYLFCYNM